MFWMVAVVVTVMVVATYVTWFTGRVERLHVRANAAYSALDAHLVRRAAAAVSLAEAAQLPSLMYAARVALDTPAEDREAAENDLTRQLREVVALDDPVFAEVVAANRRVALARQLHTDVVRDVLRIRRRLTVRCLRLGRRFPAPAYFDIDDPNLDLRIVGQRGPTDDSLVGSDVDAAAAGQTNGAAAVGGAAVGGAAVGGAAVGGAAVGGSAGGDSAVESDTAATG